MEQLRILKKRERVSSWSNPVDPDLTALVSPSSAYAEYKAGLPIQPQPFFRSPSISNVRIVQLRAELARLLLPRLLNLPAETRPAAGETVNDFIERVVREAVAKEDFGLAGRAKAGQASFAYGVQDGPSAAERRRQAAIDDLVTAHDQETAGQFTLAVISYERALACSNDIVPPQFIAKRLAALKKEHPAEFQDGLNQYMTPNRTYVGNGPPPVNTPPPVRFPSGGKPIAPPFGMEPRLAWRSGPSGERNSIPSSGHADSNSPPMNQSVCPDLRRASACALASWLIFARCTLCAEEPIEGWNQLEQAITKETAQPKLDSRGYPSQYPEQKIGAALLTQLKSALRRGDSREIEGALQQIDIECSSAGVHDATAKIRAALAARRAEKDQARREGIERLVQEARTTVHSAKTAADLDAVIVKLVQGEQLSDNSASGYAASKQLGTVRLFVMRWQEYLSCRQAGDQRGAMEKLRAAAGLEADLFPRSELLARITEEERSVQARPQQTGREIVEKLHSLDQIPAAIRELDHLQGEARSSNDADIQIPALRSELLALQDAWQCFQAGLPTQVQMNRLGFGSNPSTSRLVFPLKMMLIRIALPRILRIEKTMPLEKDESVETYLERIRADAERAARCGSHRANQATSECDRRNC